jgi:hypothetical protein
MAPTSRVKDTRMPTSLRMVSGIFSQIFNRVVSTHPLVLGIYSYIRSGRDLSIYGNLVQVWPLLSERTRGSVLNLISMMHPQIFSPLHEPENHESLSRPRSPHHRRPRSWPPPSKTFVSRACSVRKTHPVVRRRDSSSDDVSSNHIQRRRIAAWLASVEISLALQATGRVASTTFTSSRWTSLRGREGKRT